jgi:hypothetical protein
MASQRYVSRELTHFLGQLLPDDEAKYSLLVHVLRQGWLTHPPHRPNESGNVALNVREELSSNQMYVPQVVCFCDIPTDDLAIHTRKYGKVGIAFDKATLLAKGANPVFYVASSSQIHDPFPSSRRRASAGPEPPTSKEDWDAWKKAAAEERAAEFEAVMRDARTDAAAVYDQAARHWLELDEQGARLGHERPELIWEWEEKARTTDQEVPEGLPDAMRAHAEEWKSREGITPPERDVMELIRDLQRFGEQQQEFNPFMVVRFFSYLKFFDPTKYEDDPDNYYMEREWRVVGNVRFAIADVVRVYIPRDFGARLRQDIPAYSGQVTFLDQQ